MENQVFQNWGRLFTVEFDIIVTSHVPGWTNVFHFTADGNYDNYGENYAEIIWPGNLFFLANQVFCMVRCIRLYQEKTRLLDKTISWAKYFHRKSPFS